MAWPLTAARTLWNLGKAGGRSLKRPLHGTGWGKGAKGTPEVVGRPAIRPGDP